MIAPTILECAGSSLHFMDEWYLGVSDKFKELGGVKR